MDKEITVNDIQTAYKDVVDTIKKNIKQRDQLGYRIRENKGMQCG